MDDVDRVLVRWAAEHRTEPLDTAFVALGAVGVAGLVWIALAVLATWRGPRPWRNALVAAGAIWVADLASLGLKAIVGRPRPAEALPDIAPLVGGTVGSSFPSGHAATSAAGALVISALLPRVAPLLWALATAIAASRVYVGVHYPSDILGGLLIGAAAGVLARRLLAGGDRPAHTPGAPPGDAKPGSRRHPQGREQRPGGP